jgi:hypothetical protein
MKKKLHWVQKLWFPVLCVGILVFFVTAVSGLKDGNSEKEKAQLEEAIRRSVITCYAAEGVYPPDFAYVKEKYGLVVDESRYLVVYDVFAENLMPDITVLERAYEENRE